MLKTANLTGSISRNAGGLFESVRRLVQSLHSLGMELRVFGLKDEHTAADIGAWSPVPVRAYRSYWPESFGYSPRFLRDLLEFAPDITHTHGIWLYPSIATNHYCRRAKTPYVISGHGMLDPWALANSRWKKAVASFLYENAHLNGARCLRALCEPEARAIRVLGLKNDIAIIPNGVDLPTDEESTQDLVGPFQSFRDSGCKVLLYLGRLHPKKGLSLLLEAWKRTRSRRPTRDRWILAIAGWDQAGHEAELQAKTKALGLPFSVFKAGSGTGSGGPSSSAEPATAEIVFLGPQFGPDKSKCYAECDAFILPSFSEGAPMVVLEAWAYRKPVLMTPQCNLPKGFAVGAALKMETRVESIAGALEELFTASEHELLSMGNNGRTLVERDYSWTRLAHDMSILYTWILGGGPKPPSVTDY